jgi:hypothetical protein
MDNKERSSGVGVTISVNDVKLSAASFSSASSSGATLPAPGVAETGRLSQLRSGAADERASAARAAAAIVPVAVGGSGMSDYVLPIVLAVREGEALSVPDIVVLKVVNVLLKHRGIDPPAQNKQQLKELWDEARVRGNVPVATRLMDDVLYGPVLKREELLARDATGKNVIHMLAEVRVAHCIGLPWPAPGAGGDRNPNPSFLALPAR